MSILNDSNPVRKAIAYIAENNLDRAIEILLETLHHEDWSVRSYAAQIIGELGKINPDVITAGNVLDSLLKTVEKDNDGWVRESVAKAMGKIAVNTILPTADLKSIIEALNNILDKDEHDGARGTAAQSLGDIGKKNPDLVLYSLPILSRRLKRDDSWIVKYYAAYALGNIGSVRPKSVKKYVDLLREISKEEVDAGVKDSIKEALRKISEAFNALDED